MSREPQSDENNAERAYAFFPSFQRELNPILGTFTDDHPIRNSNTSSTFTGSRVPAVDLLETVDALVISAEVPGLKIEDLNVLISNDVLIVKGEKRPDYTRTINDHPLFERWYGRFRRQIPLGFVPQENAVTASFADGVLKLLIAKPTPASAHKINIKKT